MFSISTLIIDEMLDIVSARIDSGLLGGKLLIYSGPKPRSGEAITNQILLVNCTFAVVSASSALESSLDFLALTSITVVGNGTAVWCRGTNSDGVFVFDADVGRTDSTSDVRINDTNVQIGNSVTISNIKITVEQ